MLRRYRFLPSTIPSFLAIALLSAVTHAQTLQPRVMSRMGLPGAHQRNTVSTQVTKAQSVPQSSSISSFGLIDFPRSPYSTANGLNSRGDVVGFYGPNLPIWDGTEQSYLLHNNTFQELLYPGSAYTGAIAINKRGEIVGWYADPGTNGIFHAFLRKGKTYTNIDDPAFQYSVATGINNSGEIIGEAFDDVGQVHGFTINKGIYTTFDPPDSTNTEPASINSAGVIVGLYLDANSVSHGFVYQKGQFTTVDYPGASNTLLTSINDQGQILGGFGDDVIVNGEDWPSPNPFLLDQGTFTPFVLPVGDAVVTLTYTLSGSQFVGLYVDHLGNIYGFDAQINGAR